jgi:hypothetical protein
MKIEKTEVWIRSERLLILSTITNTFIYSRIVDGDHIFITIY